VLSEPGGEAFHGRLESEFCKFLGVAQLRHQSRVGLAEQLRQVISIALDDFVELADIAEADRAAVGLEAGVGLACKLQRTLAWVAFALRLGER